MATTAPLSPRRAATTLALGACLVFALLSSAEAAKRRPLAGIKGQDDRILVRSDEYPWSAIGRVHMETGGHCTGALVGPRVVVTAAHCIWNKRLRKYHPADRIHFVAGWRGGDYLQHSKARRIFIPPGYRPAEPAKTTIAAQDWALIELQKEVGRITGYLGVTRLDRDRLKALRRDMAVFIQAGYSKDKKHVLTAHVGCPLHGYFEPLPLIKHRCDAVPGDSGSPIFLFERGMFRLAAVHVATTKIKQITWGAAVPASTFIQGVKELGGVDGALPADGSLVPMDTTRQLLAMPCDHADGDLEAGVRAFEKANGLKPTGAVTHELLGHLVRALAR